MLIAEEHDDTRLRLRTLLELKSCQVLEARNGQEAVEIASSEQPDLILMDGSLPVIDGLEATRRIRENVLLQEVLILALNGWGTPSFHAAALAAGCDDCIVKPIDSVDLNRYMVLLFDRSNRESVGITNEHQKTPTLEELESMNPVERHELILKHQASGNSD